VAYLLDTNLLVYPHDARDPGKQRRATEVLTRFAGSGQARLPAQALAEFSNVLLRKFGHPAARGVRPGRSARESVHRAAADRGGGARGGPGVGAYALSYYEAQVWAVAKLNQVPVVVSEDFQEGATLEGVTFVNPFGKDFSLGQL